MVTKDFIYVISLSLAITLIVRKASAQCTTNECTVCTDIELVCEGLNNVPPLDNLDPLSTAEQLISLRNGSINEIPAGYFNLSNLVSIDLSNNQLTTLNMDSFQFARDLQTIDLTSNPIICDNNIDWLQKWKLLYPANTVSGSCGGSGENINTYLSDKPGNLVDGRFSAPSLVFDRLCSEITVPFIVIGKFTSDLVYRAYTEATSSKVHVSVANEYIAVPVGTDNSEIIIHIFNRGENRDDVQTLLQITPEYPVSYERNAVIHLQNGADGCMAPVPLISKTTQTPTVGPTVAPTPTEKESVAPTPTEKKDFDGDIPDKPLLASILTSVFVIIFTVVIICVVLFVVRCRRTKHGKDSSSKREESEYEYPGVSIDREGYSELEKGLNDKQSQRYEELNQKQSTKGKDTFYDRVIFSQTKSNAMKTVWEYEEVPVTTSLVSYNETWEISTSDDSGYEIPVNNTN